MSHLTNITKKELRELLTPSSIMSVVVVVVIFAMLGSAMSGTTQSATSPQNLLVVNGDADDYAVGLIEEAYLSTYPTVTHETYADYVTVINGTFTNEEIRQHMLGANADSAIIIESGFHAAIDSSNPGVMYGMYTYTSGGALGNITSTIAAGIINTVNTSILMASGSWTEQPVDTSKTTTYVNGTFAQGVTPSQIDSAISSQNMLIPMIIMVVIVMIGSIVIGSMGNEKENKTLETLLTMPVKRTTIVTGKLLASAITGLVFGAAYMVGMMLYMNGLSSVSVSGLSLESIGLTLDLLDWVLILVQMFLAILCALGICMTLGAFAKNYKSAQTMTLPISVLAMIPMFVIMLLGWEGLPLIAQVFMFLIPFTHPMMVMNNLMFGEMTLVLIGVAYLAIFTVAIIAVTVRLYKSDILITGLSQDSRLVKMKDMMMSSDISIRKKH